MYDISYVAISTYVDADGVFEFFEHQRKNSLFLSISGLTVKPITPIKPIKPIKPLQTYFSTWEPILFA